MCGGGGGMDGIAASLSARHKRGAQIKQMKWIPTEGEDVEGGGGGGAWARDEGGPGLPRTVKTRRDKSNTAPS